MSESGSWPAPTIGPLSKPNPEIGRSTTSPNTHALSLLIDQARGGDRAAEDQLFCLAYNQILQMVRRRFSRADRLRDDGVETADVAQIAVQQLLTCLRNEGGWERIRDEQHFFRRAARHIHWALLNLVRRLPRADAPPP